VVLEPGDCVDAVRPVLARRGESTLGPDSSRAGCVEPRIHAPRRRRGLRRDRPRPSVGRDEPGRDTEVTDVANRKRPTRVRHVVFRVQSEDQRLGGAESDRGAHHVLPRRERIRRTGLSSDRPGPRGLALSERFARSDSSRRSAVGRLGIRPSVALRGPPDCPPLLGPALRRSARLCRAIPSDRESVSDVDRIHQRDPGRPHRRRGQRAERDHASPGLSRSVRAGRPRGRPVPVGLPSDELSRRARLGHRLLLQPDAVGSPLLSFVQGLDGSAPRPDRADPSTTASDRGSIERSRRIYICGYGLARRMADLKTITDTVHGTIRLDPLTLDLLETLELQRLNSIRQLGLTYLVFPGANHSRVEHCLGVGHVAGEMARALGLPDDERKLVQAAGLLHDVGHGPFSHTLEHVLSRELAVDHMHLTQRIITGDDDNVSPDDRRAFPDVLRIHQVLEKHGVDPSAVAALIRGPSERGASLLVPGTRKESRRYLAQIIHSPMDADQIDYLMRDAHYTGAAHGTIDFSRLLQTLRTYRGELALDRKGLPALEGMLVARGLMYSSVYFHKTVRIAEEMLSRAVERSEAPIGEIQKMVDHELLNWLVHQGPFQREIALRLKYRKLYKRVLASDRDELTDATRSVLASFKDPEERRRVEDRIARRAGLEPGQVIIDVPLPELLLSEPRIAKTEVPILDDGEVKPFSKVSPLGRALQVRQVVDWVVMVAAPAEAVDAVRKASKSALFE